MPRGDALFTRHDTRAHAHVGHIIGSFGSLWSRLFLFGVGFDRSVRSSIDSISMQIGW